jgi:glycosyltransferase involved in cell wall biosynthesis
MDRYDVVALVTPSNEFNVAGLTLETRHVRSARDRFPNGRLGRAMAYAAGDHYIGLEQALAGADIVHSADLHTWFTDQAARLRRKLGFWLVATVWETIPYLNSYRWPRERRYRRRSLGAIDLFLPASERAARTLLLEGVPTDRIRVSYPGVDQKRFRPDAPDARAHRAEVRVAQHTILSPGRLVWEKGHQDVLRAVAALKSGLVPGAPAVRLVIVGSGPEERRLRAHARELGIQDAVEFRLSVSYDDMPALYRASSAMVLASLPRRGWEEQFGMVLAEALASRTPIVASRSGAIPEVVGDAGSLFEPGDWHGLAVALRDGPLRAEPGARSNPGHERVERYSLEAAAARLAAAYETLT